MRKQGDPGEGQIQLFLTSMGLVIATLVGVVVATVSGLALGCVPGGLTRDQSLLALLLGFISAFTLWRGFDEKGLRMLDRELNESSRSVGFWDILLLGIFAFAAFRAFLWLVFPADAQWRIGSPYNIGDLALHWQMIANLAYGAHFWPQNPIFVEGLLRYPAGMSLFNALFLQAGVPMREILIWSGLLGSTLAAWTLWRWAGAFGVAMFLFSGSLAGWMVQNAGWPWQLPQEIEWKNLFHTVFVTQRGFLWALPAGVVLLWIWRQRLAGAPVKVPFFAEFCFYAGMPLFHLHTFLFLSLLLAACFLCATGRRRWQFLLLVVAAFFPAALFVFLVTGGFAPSTGMVGWAPGWLMGEGGAWFWWVNFGISLPLFAWLAWVVARSGDCTARVFVGVALGVLLVCFFVRFAPWPWDNVKLMLWTWVTVAPFLWQYVLQPLALWARAILLVLLLGGGAVELFAGLSVRHFYDWVPRLEWDETRAVLAGLPVHGTRLGTAPTVPHPAALQGYSVVVGYDGHLWSHGYDYIATKNALENFYRTGIESPLLAKMTHVLLGPREVAQFGDRLREQTPPGWRMRKTTEKFLLLERIPVHLLLLQQLDEEAVPEPVTPPATEG